MDCSILLNSWPLAQPAGHAVKQDIVRGCMTESKVLKATVLDPKLGSLSVVEGQEFPLEVEIYANGIMHILAEIFYDNDYLSLTDGLPEYQLSPGNMEQSHALSWELKAKRASQQPTWININIKGDNIAQKCGVTLSIIKR